MTRPKTWVVLDAHNLAYRALHDPRNGEVKIEDVHDLVLEALLADIVFFQERYTTDHVVVTFDHGKCKRHDMVKNYKKHDTEPDGYEKARKDEVRACLKLLRTKYLHEVGYRNVLSQEGYEADDVMASVVLHSIGKEDTAVLVSSDKDLYQLLSDRVSIWTPHQRKEVTLQSFWRQYAIAPKAWPLVKAVAGCVSDNVKGVYGVGEPSALRWVRGDETLHKRYWDLIEAGRDVWQANLGVVGLPLPGTERFVLVPDRVTRRSWEAFCTKHGLDRAATLRPVGHTVPF